MLTYFHATRSTFSTGTVIRAGGAPQHSTQRIGWLDALFDAQAPAGCPRRQTCLFAFENLSACGWYADSVGGEGWSFYEVALGDPVIRAPWHLTSVAVRLGQGHPAIVEPAKTYWAGAAGWRYREYLSDEMTIVKDVTGTVPTGLLESAIFVAPAQIQLGMDMDQAKTFWP